MTYSPRHEWPNLTRYNLTVRIPHAYKVDPNDNTIFVPDYDQIQYFEEAMDHIDNGSSLREVASWLSEKINRKISHQGIFDIWKKYRSKDKDNPRAKQLRKRRRAIMPKTKEGKQERLLRYAVTSAERSLKVRKRKLAEIQGVVVTDSPPLVDSTPTDDLEGREVVFKPHAGPQEAFLAATEQEILYGGPLALDTKVMVPYGEKTIGDLAVGDLVITPSGLPSSVVEIPFIGVEDSYLITFNDGSTVTASAGHEWLVATSDWKKTNTPYRVKKTIELLDFKLSRNRNKYMLPVSQDIIYPAVPHVISPYIVGVLLGDGTFTIHKTPTFVSVDSDIISRVSAESPKELTVKLSGNSISYSISRQHGTHEPNPITSELSRLGLTGTRSLTKFIPDEYKYDSIENRYALLQGLMDTDGTVRENNRRSAEAKYTTISEKLRDDFIYLARSLGYRTTWHSETIASGSIAYRVLLSGPKNPFHLTRKSERFSMFNNRQPHLYISNIQYVGKREVKCISLDSAEHLFLLSGCIITRNSAGGGKSYALLADPMRYFDNPNFNGVLFRKTNDELRELIMKSQGLYDKAFPTMWNFKWFYNMITLIKFRKCRTIH